MSSSDIKGAINKMIDTKLSNLHTIIPAVVISYDEEKNNCTVQPLYKINNQSLPQLINVPVAQFRLEGAIKHLHLEPNDLVLLAICELPIDGIGTKTVHEPQFQRKYSLSDAIVICMIGGI